MAEEDATSTKTEASLVQPVKTSKVLSSKVLSGEEKYILYALGKSYQAFNTHFSDKPLEVTISKVVFIDLLISSNSVKKKGRAIYKNLESLEKKGYIRYHDKELGFNKKGLKAFEALDKDIKNYFDLNQHIQSPETISTHKKIQTKLKH